jgi:hypothetical protein
MGLFITLILLSYYKINEKFTITDNVLDKINTKPNNNNYNDSSILPLSGYKFICINTYNGLNKISQTNGRWYDIDSDENKTYDFNYNNYFKYTKTLNIHDNSINKNGAKGININEIELNGPSCFNFANNSETYELTSFTMFMTTKINSCSMKNNIIFEMTGNTTTINSIRPEYSPLIININLIVNEELNYNINVTIGNTVYNTLINNIDRDIIHDNDYITIGLQYNDNNISLYLNKKIYVYTNINKFKITLGSTPLIINKNGTINMSLYNFVYYKSNISNDNFYKYIEYNNYYISGLDDSNKKCIKDKEDRKEETKEETKEDTNVDKIYEKIPEFKYDEIVDYYTPDILKKIFDY